MIYDYTLCYNPEDEKLYIGRDCGEEKEVFQGRITGEAAQVTGYSGKGNILTLQNFSFATSADIALAVPDGTIIQFEGDNVLQVINDREEANVGVLYSSGDLTLSGKDPGSRLRVLSQTEQGLWSRAICARAGNLSITGGTIVANGGTARKSCGVYAGGHLWIDQADKGHITLTGGSLAVTSGKNAVRAAEGRLTVAEGAHVKNVKEYEGGRLFQGDCLSPIDETRPVEVFFSAREHNRKEKIELCF